MRVLAKHTESQNTVRRHIPNIKNQTRLRKEQATIYRDDYNESVVSMSEEITHYTLCSFSSVPKHFAVVYGPTLLSSFLFGFSHF